MFWCRRCAVSFPGGDASSSNSSFVGSFDRIATVLEVSGFGVGMVSRLLYVLEEVVDVVWSYWSKCGAGLSVSSKSGPLMGRFVSFPPLLIAEGWWSL